jgi:Ribose/xylose/arabinose/galactoside ABC-type transport systems, permease components
MNNAVSPDSKKPKNRLVSVYNEFSKNYAIFFALLVLFIFLSFASKAFLSVDNIMNMLRQGSIVAILAAGEFFVIISGQTDLSIGSTLALSGVLYAFMVKWPGMPPLLAAVLCILACMVIGAIGGTLVNFGIPAFISTLGLMLTVRGLVYVLTNCYPIINLPPDIKNLGRGYFLGIPIPALIMFGVFIVVAVVAAKLPIGRYLYTIGGNEEAALLSGIKVDFYRMLAFTICAALAGLAGIILTSRLDSGQANAGLNYEFEAIIAVVIGGVSFKGGKGKAIGALIGALFMATLINGMTLLSVNSYIQQIIKGVVFVLAIGIDVIRNRSKK